VRVLLRTTKAHTLKDVLCLEKIFIKHAENIMNARARCTVFDSDRDEEPQ
jgi:hypothetical protein